MRRKVRKSGKLVQGVGVNDADYSVSWEVNSKRISCPFYRTWAHMIFRCYSTRYPEMNPTYIGCTVVHEWHYFMTFRRWMESQDWKGKQLDKDLLVEGNKVYSPDTCIFLPGLVNKFMTDRKLHRGDCPLGVYKSYYKGRVKYRAKCAGLGKGENSLGEYATQEKAHQVYMDFKKRLAIELASQQTDMRIANALIKRYVKE